MSNVKDQTQRAPSQTPVTTLPIREVGKDRPRIAKAVETIKPYDAVSSLPRILSRPEIEHFKLDWNESTIPPSPHVKKAVLKFLEGFNAYNYYPQLFSTDLRTKLQTYVGYPTGQIMVTNGSDDALELICKTYLNPGEEVVTPYPTYTHFLLYVQSRGGVVTPVTPSDPFEANIDDVIAAINDHTKIVYMVNPNNPTGLLFSNEEIARLAAAAPHVVILVDEAYFEFCGQTALPLVSRFENVIVTRSFSKAFGLAGLRIGYLVAPTATIDDLSRLYNPKSVNAVAQVAAGAILEDLEYYHRYVEEVTRSKDLLGKWCRLHGLQFRSTPGNFVMIRVPELKEVVEALADEGVYVRDRSGFAELKGYFRLNLGTVAQTTQVIRRLERVLTRFNLLPEPATES